MTLEFPTTPSVSISSSTGLLASPNLVQPPLHQHATASYSDLIPSVPLYTDLTSLSTPTALSTQFDEYFASSISFPMLNTPDADSFNDFPAHSQGMNNFLDSSGVGYLSLLENHFPAIDDPMSDLPTRCRPLTPPDSRTSVTSGPQRSGDGLSEPSCCCLAHALRLLKELSPNASAACAMSRNQSQMNGMTSQLPTLQSVISRNEQTIEEIKGMLQCPCSQDGYLLAIMSLIVFKVLGWYEEAACRTSAIEEKQTLGKIHPDVGVENLERVKNSPTGINRSCVEGGNQNHMIAHQIMSELHRVQRLVNMLSQRLNSQGGHHGGQKTFNTNAAEGQNSFSDTETSFPFLVTILHQLEIDLRNRLRSLTAEIVHMLR